MPYMVKVTLKDVLKARKITQQNLSDTTGIRMGSLSDMSTKSVINKDHLARICEALKISDFRELINLEWVDADIHRRMFPEKYQD